MNAGVAVAAKAGARLHELAKLESGVQVAGAVDGESGGVVAHLLVAAIRAANQLAGEHGHHVGEQADAGSDGCHAHGSLGVDHGARRCGTADNHLDGAGACEAAGLGGLTQATLSHQCAVAQGLGMRAVVERVEVDHA